jgi:hypothetical protein
VPVKISLLPLFAVPPEPYLPRYQSSLFLLKHRSDLRRRELVHDIRNVHLSKVRAIAFDSKESSAPGSRNRAFRNHHDEHESVVANAAAMDFLSSSYTCYTCVQNTLASFERQRKAIREKV